MTKHACMALLVSLGISGWLLCHGPGGVAVTFAQSPPETKFGGTYRRTLFNNPPTLDPAFTTDVFSRAVVSQLFDGLVQFDAHLNPIPALAEFWGLLRTDAPGPSICAVGSNSIMDGR